jgi:hypothetical protein
MRTTLCWVGWGVAILVTAMPALATAEAEAERSQPVAANPGGLEVVVVTARRREETLPWPSR